MKAENISPLYLYKRVKYKAGVNQPLTGTYRAELLEPEQREYETVYDDV